MNNWDYALLILYFLSIFGIVFFRKNNRWIGLFSAHKRRSWWISGVSIFMITVSADWGQIIAGIIGREGVSGLWLLWGPLLGAGVIPVLFAPIWKRLDLPTDNHFIKLRYSGPGATILSHFRAIYVGYLIMSILVSFQLLAFTRIIHVFFSIPELNSMYVASGLVLLFILKNRFSFKLNTDFIHGILYVSCLLLVFYLLMFKSVDWNEILYRAEIFKPKSTHLFHSERPNFWLNWGFYVFFMWWLSNQFDGGGQETQRFTSAFSEKDAIRTAVLSTLLILLVGFLTILIIVIALSNPHSVSDLSITEVSFIEIIYTTLPVGLKSIGFIALFGAFISTAESQLNWGASIIMTTNFNRFSTNKSATKKHLFGYSIMIVIGFTSILLSYLFDSLYEIMIVCLSVSAGVAPLYIIRWFWMRINAWSQLSAMVSSLFFTILFKFYPPDIISRITGLNDNNALVLTVSLCTILIWLLITLTTPKTNEAVISNFEKKIGVSAFNRKRLLIAFSLGISFFLFNTFLYYLVLN